MNNSRAASTDKNKKYIEERVQEIGGKRGLEGLTTEWEDPPDKTTGTYNLRVHVPEHDPVVIPFLAYDLRWETYYPEPGEDVEAFSKNEKKLKAGSYNRKQQWDERIRQALSVGFGQSNNPIGFIR